MNTNSSKQHLVMSADSLQNKHVLKKRELEEVHQGFLNSKENPSSSTNHGFLKFCKKTSVKRFDDKDLQTINDFTESGKIFNFII